MEKFPLWTAMITPMHADGSIDYDSFETILEKQEKAGNGVLILGSTGEGLNIRTEEKKEIIKFVSLLNLEVPVMAGIGGHDLNSQVALMNYCDEVGVDAFLLVTPLYAKPGKEGQLAWFSALIKETKTPCMIYNVPSRTGVKMDPLVPAYLHRTFPNYMGLKEASGSLEEFKAFRDHAPKAALYCGDDGLMKDFAEAGAVGLVSVASNVWPEKTHNIVKLILEEKYDQVYEKWSETANLLFTAPNPVPVKSLMEHKGWISGNNVRLPLSVDDLSTDAEEKLLEADKAFNDWFESLDK
jgi:4-hydroxy-tetrahydrodipicolinate synthase